MPVDELGRRFRTLRVSLTAACNYACVYCVPDGKRLLPAREELSGSELMALVELIRRATGIEKLRITGGEPLLAADFDEFLHHAMTLSLADVSLTTNGQLLLKKRDAIVESGLQRINVSLDTLNPLRFRQIARGGDLATVLVGIDAMQTAGVQIKINMVPLRSLNGSEIVQMLDFCMARGIELRFIELMRMGHLLNNSSYEEDFMSRADLLDIIGRKYEFHRIHAPFDSTSVRFEIPHRGTFGIIANESEPFCANCTRLRLSSDGYLYGCLGNSRKHYVKDLLGSPAETVIPELSRRLTSALGDKRLAFQGETTVMKLIGG